MKIKLGIITVEMTASFGGILDSEYIEKLEDAVEVAWGVIANVGHRQGGWEKQDKEWLDAAILWRDTRLNSCMKIRSDRKKITSATNKGT